MIVASGKWGISLADCGICFYIKKQYKNINNKKNSRKWNIEKIKRDKNKYTIIIKKILYNI